MLICMASETKIRVLPVHVASKIAAGEVVERPASVLKELVENALDAGATQIDVAVTAGGRKLIAVSDNGRGMNHDDALLCIEPQATSKIRDVDDIENINTLGFRGEALAAIASVSRFKLTTCDFETEGGTEVTVAGGKIQDVRDVGCPVGTSIEVRDLFFNIPARRKFLRTHQTELAHVRSAFLVQALGCPRAGFSLNVDGREIYRLAGAGEFEDRLRDLFGPEYSDNLVQVRHDGGSLKITGYISQPALSRADRDEQFIYVNGRATGAAVIGFAIKEAYRTCMPKDRHPAVFLHLGIDPGHVDVNVHPTKREIRFRKPGEVRDVLIAAMDSSLGGNGAVVSDNLWKDERRKRPGGTEIQMRIENLPETPVFHYPRAEHVPADDGGMAFAPHEDSASAPKDAPTDVDDTFDSPWSWCRVVGLVGGQFVMLETEDGYVVMDPRAAHERVLYERFLADVAKDKISSQSMLIPETAELKPADALRVRKHVDLLKSMGFGISEFGGDAFVVDAMPAYFSDASSTSLLVEVAAGLEAAGARKGQTRWREEAIAKAACHAAVDSRDKLKLEEIEQLVVDLARTVMPYTCPRGRPTLIFTSFKELGRKFGRESR
jgi:DNA mismatch repair protein MutL